MISSANPKGFRILRPKKQSLRNRISKKDREVGLRSQIAKVTHPVGRSCGDSGFLSFTALAMIFLSSLFLCFISLCFVVECGLVILRETKVFSVKAKVVFSALVGVRMSMKRMVVLEFNGKAEGR